MPLSKKVLLCLALGLLLVARPASVGAQEDDDEDEAAAEDDDKDVLVATDDNFGNMVGGSKYALVEFYAPWCGHCKSLKPEYAKAATILKEHDPEIKLVKLDATKETVVAGNFDVKGYPTLKWFVDGKMAGDYTGGRSADEIVRWVKKKTGPPTTTVDSLDALDEKTKDSKVYVLGYFGSLDDSASKTFDAAARSEDAAFFTTTSAEVAAKLGLDKHGIVLARNFPDFGLETVPASGHPALEDKSSDAQEQLINFVKAEKLPAYIEFTPTTSSDIFGSGINHQVIVTATEDDLQQGTDLTKAMVEAANALKGKVVFVSSKAGSEDGKPIAGFFGLDDAATAPQVVGFFTQGGKKYKFEGEVTADALKEFGEQVVAGTAPKMSKSAAVPEKPEEKGVTIVVGSTVDSVVKDPKKDVLLEVYAPWCGHCKQLVPIYEKLAKRFSKVDSVVIAKMDGTENEHPDLEVQGFPTIIFFPAAEDATPIPYDGERTLPAFTKFIKKHAKVPFELPKKKKKGGKAKKDADEAGHDEL